MNRILVVDDKEENQYMLRALLEGNGFTVELAGHGAEALEKARQHPPNLIVADILMPVMDGFALCREWKKDARLRPIPFVFYTATYTDERDREFALGLGAERFVVKPKEPDDLLAIIREVFQQVQRPASPRTKLAADTPVRLPIKTPEEENVVYLKQYNAVLIRKLEGKMEQLEKINRELERDVAERKRAEVALRQSASLRQAAFDATADGILAVDSERRIIAFNQRFVEMWHITQSVMEKRDDCQLLACVMEQLKDPDGFAAKIQALYNQPEQEGWDMIEFKDGRVFERFSNPQRMADQIVGRVWDFRDVTARKQAEAELEQMHRQLQETSRQAGMAEMASSVLHNIGNVINSINVASTCVADSLKESKAANLSKVVALLREHQTDLGAFLTNDSRGKLVPGYLAQLADHLAEERTRVLKELGQMQSNVGHIKDIVTMQQSLTKMAGVTESLKMAGLVEDALNINASALAHRDIRVIKDYSDGPALMTEKHKVLQILINLLRNAMQACDEAKRPDKKLTISVTHGPNRVRVAVADNGIGIPPEYLTRIFTHGFTTKKDGHGFGLHSGAQAAGELGGSLTAHSDGPGQGAVFTLELPYQKGEQHDPSSDSR